MKALRRPRVWFGAVLAASVWLAFNRSPEAPYLEIAVCSTAALIVLVGEGVANQLGPYLPVIPQRFTARCGVLTAASLIVGWIGGSLGAEAFAEQAANVAYVILVLMVIGLGVEAFRSDHAT